MNLKDREKVIIALYNEHKSSYEIGKVINLSTRRTREIESELRKAGKIKPREEFLKLKEKTKFKHKEVLEETKIYLDASKKIREKYTDIYTNIKLKTIWGQAKQTEDQVLLFSDMHTGMINTAPITGEITYNEPIQEQELQNLTRGIFRFYSLYKPSYNIETLHIFALGDLVTNNRIYEGQISEITCGIGLQIEKTLNYVSDMLKKLLEIYPKIVYIQIYGNHSRTTAKPIAEAATDSFEYLLGLLLQERFGGNKRIEIILPKDYSYTYIIKGHRYLLMHGNSVRGSTLNSIEKAAKEISLLVEHDNYSVITMGHFHSCYEFPISPTTTMLVNGCFIFKDSYAYTKLRKFSTAKQYLFNVSNKSPLHNLQKLDLRWKI